MQMLVAGAIDQMMLDQVEYWISRPGSPNLTWPLANLPRPMLDVQGGLAYERAGIGYALPELKPAAEGTLSGEQLRSLLARIHDVEDVEPEQKAKGFDATGEALRRIARDLAGARVYLQTEAGEPAARLDAMQPPAILGLYYASSFERYQQEFIKWFGAPYPQAARGMAQAAKEFEQFRRQYPDNRLLALTSAYQRVLLSAVRVDRRVDELRCLEAIRAYMAAHDGKLPAALRDVTEAPVPPDVATGAEFPYAAHGDEARLDAPIPRGGTDRDGRRYELRAK